MKLRIVMVLAILITSWAADAHVPERLLLVGPPPRTLPPVVAEFIHWETRTNPGGVRSDKPFWIEHLEIPLSAVGEDKAFNLDPRIHKSLIFEKNGVAHVRWLLNPEDTKWGAELESSLRDRGIAFERGRHFIGYLTASRSCIVHDPDSGVIFSIKSSTNETGGSWTDKKESSRAARAARLISDFFARRFRTSENSAFRAVPETLAFSFGPADQAIVVRQYDHFNDPRPRHRLIPAFAITHDKEGKRLAELNGSHDPNSFWAKHMVLG